MPSAGLGGGSRSGEKRFRYRLVASEVTQQLGYEMRARYAEDIPESERRSYILELYGRAVATAAPQYEKGELFLDGRLWRHESMVLPLAKADGTVDLLLVYRRSEIVQNRGGSARHRNTRRMTWATRS